LADLEKITRKRLGELLVAEGMITHDQLAAALRVQEQTGELLGEALVKAGFTTETEIAKTLCTQFAKPFLKPSKYDIAKEILALLPPKLLAEHQIVPVDRFGNLLVIAMAGLLDQATFGRIQQLTGCELEVYITTASDLKLTLRKAFPELYDPITMLPKLDSTAALTGAVRPTQQKFLETQPSAALDLGKVDASGKKLTPTFDRTEKTKLPPIDDMGLNTTGMRALTAEEEGDWDALFEEAEKQVLRNLNAADSNPEPPKKKKKG
jgi:type IV pilus assembly protein PilB